jgi:replicative DNA helicase
MPIGIPEMDRHWRYKKNFTIINGHSNIGKTTFALYLQVASAMKFNWKWAVYSSENKTAAIKMRLMTFAMGMPINQMTNAQVRSSYEWVNKHFIIIDNSQTYSVHDIILFSHKLMNNEGIDGVFIDPYNGLKRDMKNAYSLGVHEYDYEAVSELLTLSNSSNIAVWLNVHAVTEAQRVKGKDGLPVPPFAEQTEGGAKFVNRADDFITLHRKIQHPDPAMRRLVEMHIRKIRETETGGSPTGFEEPLTFQANQQRDTFYFRDGSRLFKPLYEHPF